MKTESREKQISAFVLCPILGFDVHRARCMFCSYGHMLECHYPFTCDEAECDHYKSEMEADQYPIEIEDNQIVGASIDEIQTESRHT